MRDKELPPRKNHGQRVNQIRAQLAHLEGKLTTIAASGKGKIIDVGCGVGASIEALKESFPLSNLYAVDNQEDFVREARSRGIVPSKNIICQDALDYLKSQSSHSVNLITAFEASPPLLPLQEITCEAARVLKKGGQMIVSTWVNVENKDVRPAFDCQRISEMKGGSPFEDNLFLLTKQ